SADRDRSEQGGNRKSVDAEHWLVTFRLTAGAQERKSRQGIARIGNKDGVPCRRFYQRENADGQGSEEAAFRCRYRCEIPLSISSQPQAIARIGPRCIPFRGVEITGHDHIEIAVAIDVTR